MAKTKPMTPTASLRFFGRASSISASPVVG
jgi:hypothetical protein